MTNWHLNSFLLIAAIIISAITLRVIHIDADTPSGLSWSAGLYVDEGYKTLAPRNLHLFGKTHWHPADTYPGWMKYSPVTQWPVYAAFKSFGADISSARLAPIIYFCLLMLLYVFFLNRRYTSKLFYLGLILLGTDVTLFTFSRVALFEIPLSFFLYSLILPLSLINEEKLSSRLPILWLIVGGVAIAYSIKLSALVYITPVIASVSILILLSRHRLSRNSSILLFAVLSSTLLGLLVITYRHWGARIGITPQSFLYAVIENPLLATSPSLVIAGMICAAHAIVFQSSLYLKDMYRISLISMVVTAPFLLSLFPYHPLRYYVPFLPAYMLLIIEWFSTTSSITTSRIIGYVRPGAGLFIICLAVMYVFIALELHEHIQMRFLIAIGAGVVLALMGVRHFLFSITIATVAGLVALSILQNFFFIGSFIKNPSYDANNMRDRLIHIVKEDEVVSGGWAPFLALGTPIRVIYANTEFNPPASLKAIQPDYFLLSKTPTAMKAFEIIKNDRDICVGAPFDLGSYNKTRVMLYPLSYNTPCD